MNSKTENGALRLSGDASMTDQEKAILREQIRDAICQLAAKGLIYDSGERRDGQIVWRIAPGKEAELALLERTADLEEGFEE